MVKKCEKFGGFVLENEPNLRRFARAFRSKMGLFPGELTRFRFASYSFVTVCRMPDPLAADRCYAGLPALVVPHF